MDPREYGNMRVPVLRMRAVDNRDGRGIDKGSLFGHQVLY
ncbi:unnamed protein product [Cuscuta epithymum]|uniref:Uncharacterized protein n=1 Tax=Cuscuta epithymum TaxID=186058 RepID=A0AAV0CQJ9_9ASTE|nr:unnamed protein product [Cuscuta epithymum]CAH9137887.1 unnamed protein product [Cuscuta epithymum]